MTTKTSGGGQGVPSPASGSQYPSWIVAILKGIAAPITVTTTDNLAAWHQCELSSAQNNPFNTTLKAPGSSPINNLGGGVGVQTYPSAQVGLQATVNTLLFTKAFGPIVTALRNGADRASFASTVGNSGWGTSGACIAQAPGLNGSTAYMGGGSVTGAGGAPTSAATAAGAFGCHKNDKGDNCWISPPGNWCLTYCEAKGALGGLAMFAGGILVLAGLVIVARGAVQKAAAGVLGAVPAGRGVTAAASTAGQRSQAGLGPKRTIPSPSSSAPGPGRAPRRASPKAQSRQAAREGTEAYDAGYQRAMADFEARARELEVPF